MCRILLILVFVSLVSPLPVFGQDRPKLEIGTSAAVGVLDTGGEENVTFVSLPGGSHIEGASMYLSFFPSERLAVEPELSLRRESQGDDSVTRIGLTGRVKYLFRGVGEGSPYLAGQAGLLRLSVNESATGYSFGGGIGYRVPVAGSLAMSVEGRYRRWTGEDLFRSDDASEIGVVVMVGGVVGR